MNKRKFVDILSIALLVLGIVAFFAAGALFQWWRCGEMFPHARLACFLGGK